VTQIKKPLQNAPRDVDTNNKLQALWKGKEKEEAMYIEDTQRLVTEIEMLRVVLYLAFALRPAF
jgi:hypothetical protein